MSACLPVQAITYRLPDSASLRKPHYASQTTDRGIGIQELAGAQVPGRAVHRRPAGNAAQLAAGGTVPGHHVGKSLRRQSGHGREGDGGWLLRFLLHPKPSLALAAKGTVICDMGKPFREVAESLGYKADSDVGVAGTGGFAGPASGNLAESAHLACTCWALALLTEAYRSPAAMIDGPLSGLRDGR
jgi:hypothetical protein